jgi:hypothetical protein
MPLYPNNRPEQEQSHPPWPTSKICAELNLSFVIGCSNHFTYRSEDHHTWFTFDGWADISPGFISPGLWNFVTLAASPLVRTRVGRKIGWGWKLFSTARSSWHPDWPPWNSCHLIGCTRCLVLCSRKLLVLVLDVLPKPVKKFFADQSFSFLSSVTMQRIVYLPSDSHLHYVLTPIVTENPKMQGQNDS